MTYSITYSPEAKEDIAKLKRSEPASFKKVVKLLNEELQAILNELIDHPKTGTGHPEPLKGMPFNRWSLLLLRNIVLFIVFLRPKYM